MSTAGRVSRGTSGLRSSTRDATPVISGAVDEFLSDLRIPEHKAAFKRAMLTFATAQTPESAFKVYESFLKSFRMTGLLCLLEAVRDYEQRASCLLPKHRDHYVHAVNVFQLGITLFVRLTRLRDQVLNGISYPDAYTPLDLEFAYRWGLASLFHDLGYPLEIASGLISAYCDTVVSPSIVVRNGLPEYDRHSTRHHTRPVVMLQAKPDLLGRLHLLPPRKSEAGAFYTKYPELESLRIETAAQAIAWNLSHRLAFTTMKASTTDVIALFEAGGGGQVDHALVSAFVFLRWMNQLFSRTGWNPAYFYYSVIDAASAIFLHNSLGYFYSNPPILLAPLKASQHPIAWLLFLCDHLQESNRTRYHLYKDLDGHGLVELDFRRGGIRVVMRQVEDWRGPEGRKEAKKIEDQLHRALNLEETVATVKLRFVR